MFLFYFCITNIKIVNYYEKNRIGGNVKIVI